MTKQFPSQKGFILVTAIILFLILSAMALTIFLVSRNDIDQDINKDYYQQAKYTAKTALALAQVKILEAHQIKSIEEIDTTLVSINDSSTPCSANLFGFNSGDISLLKINDEIPNPWDQHNSYMSKSLLADVPTTTSTIKGDSLDELEQKRLENFIYYYFISFKSFASSETNTAYSAGQSGYNSSAALSNNSHNENSSILPLTIYACGVYEGSNDKIIVAVQNDILLIK